MKKVMKVSSGDTVGDYLKRINAYCEAYRVHQIQTHAVVLDGKIVEWAYITIDTETDADIEKKYDAIVEGLEEQKNA